MVSDVIKLASGPVSGVKHGEVNAYLGIPFALPPVGDLRWKPPRPVAPWKEIRGCTGYGLACPQPPSKFYDVGRTSEDCLYLNVWAPSGGGGRGLPVMVWIHGGAFTTGAGSLGLYHGKRLAARGVIVVTINYRLGPLGFLAHPALSAESPHCVSGNYGLLDQVAALEWVRHNISSFGGDGDCVTVFGESAGAVSACLLMSSPRTAGLFHRAIAESGPIWVEKGLPAASRPLAAAEETGLKLAEKLKADGDGAPLESLRAVPARKLVEIASPGEGLEVLETELQFGPVIDGWLLPGDLPVRVAAGDIHDLPLLVGSNASEANLFLEGMSVKGSLYRQLAGFLFGEHAGEALDYFPVGDGEDASSALSLLFTVSEFAAPARFLARSFGPMKSKAYLYNFSRSAPGNPLGACHGSEIPYVFGNFDSALGYADADFRLSETVMSYWTSFARTGSPDHSGLPEWPAYCSNDDRLLEFGEAVSVREAPHGEACDLAEKVHLDR